VAKISLPTDTKAWNGNLKFEIDANLILYFPWSRRRLGENEQLLKRKKKKTW
jgi:hypothetical protein